MQIVSAELQPHGLNLETNDGEALYVNYIWLRDNCPSSWDEVTRDRSFDITAIPPDLKATAVGFDGTDMIVTWEGDGKQSRYDVNWLIKWLRNPGHADPASLLPRAWRAEMTGHVAEFSFDDVLGDWATRCTYFETLIRDGLALINDVPEDNGSITRIVEVAGIVRGGFSGLYFNVRAYPKPQGAAYTANALEPHTDNPCEEYPPSIQYLHCLRNEARGGESTFADAVAVAADLKASDPEAFELLATYDVPFRFSHDGLDMRARQKVIMTDARGEVTGVTVSQHMADIFDMDQRVLDRYYPAFHRFLTMLRAPEYEAHLTLKSGQCVVFDNQRIVHGRRAFDPTSGTRILRGCYSDRGEMRSRYRVLLRDGEIRDVKVQGAD